MDKSNDLKLRIASLKKIEDQKLYKDLVSRQSMDRKIRMAAISLMNDHSDILDIFRKTELPLLFRKLAVRRLAAKQYPIRKDPEVDCFINEHQKGKGLDRTFVLTPTKQDWQDISDEIIADKVSWSYMDSQTVIHANYRNWHLIATMGNFQKVELSLENRTDKIDWKIKSGPVCEKLFSIF